MATLADSTVGTQGPSGLTAFIDKWIYVFMAALFFVTVLVGFIPDSIGLVGEVNSGQQPPLPAILHVHAVLMGSWITLLLVQAVLMATGRSAFHKQLGMIGFALVPAIVVAGIILVPTMLFRLIEGVRAAPPQIAPSIHATLNFLINVILFQVRVGILFPTFAGIALYMRLRNPGIHKRLLFLATALPLPAAIDRMNWLPTSLPVSPWSTEIYMLALLSPMFLWDLYRLRTVHKAYIIWFIPTLVGSIVMNGLWGSAWWHETALKMLGAPGL